MIIQHVYFDFSFNPVSFEQVISTYASNLNVSINIENQSLIFVHPVILTS